MSDYFKMGYINMIYEDNRYMIAANKPTLILMVPSVEYEETENRGKYTSIKLKTVRGGDGKYKCMLSGGRSPKLISQVLDNQRCKRLKYECEVIKNDNPLLPSTIFIYATDRNTFRNLSNECSLDYQEIIYSETLLESLPSVDEYREHVLNVNNQMDFSENNHYRSIDYNKMAALFPEKYRDNHPLKNMDVDKREIKENDIVTYNPDSKDEECTVMHYDGRMYEVDKYWGHFIGMQFSEAKVLIHDEGNNTINLPNQIRLPMLYARALTLITGKTPESTFGGIVYNLVANPTSNACKPESILNKLGQF